MKLNLVLLLSLITILTVSATFEGHELVGSAVSANAHV